MARRLAADPVVLLAAIRDGSDSPLADTGLAEVRLERLDPAAARALLDARAPDLPAAVRARLLDEAAGNPLALVELRAALGSELLSGAAPLPAWLPLTTRLERAFAARLSELPNATRTLLLLAAVNDGGDLQELLSAGAALLGDVTLAADALEPAVRARLAEADEARLRFRHPLVRSAIHQAASVAQRRAAHAALADTLADHPDRRAWHRAAASIGPDEGAAAELEAAAVRARRRGALAIAGLAFERAANLSEDAAGCTRRLLGAAEAAFDLGRREDYARTVQAAASLDLADTDRARMAAMSLLFEGFGDGGPGDVPLLSLVDLAERTSAEGDSRLALHLLNGAAYKCWLADPGASVGEAIITIAERASPADDDPVLLCTLALADPIGRGASVVERLSRVPPEARLSARVAHYLSGAAQAAGSHHMAARFGAIAGEAMRAQGRLGNLAQVLVMSGRSSIFSTMLDQADSVIEEGRALARETGQSMWASYAHAGRAMVAGLRGDTGGAEAHAAAAEGLAQSTQNSALLAELQWARGVAALGARRHEDAFNHLLRLYSVADPARHRAVGYQAIDYFAEAALYSGHREDALAKTRELEAGLTGTPAPRAASAALCERDPSRRRRRRAPLSGGASG